jgi:hypothetical protein
MAQRVTALLSDDLRGTALGAILAEPARLLDAADARFVKDHRRTAVAAATVAGRRVFIKRFKPYAWYRRLEWVFAPTPARRCWQRSIELERAGFRVAPPLALAETRRFALPADCYFVTAALEGTEPAGRFWREAARRLSPRARRSLVVGLAAELRRLHDAGFYSGDANADNFLVRMRDDGGVEFFLLDLEHVRRPGRISERRRAKNVVQVYRPIRGEVRRLDRLRFLRAYAGRALRDLAAWIEALEALDRKKEAEYRARARRRDQDVFRGSSG